jgi:Transposase DDE domain
LEPALQRCKDTLGRLPSKWWPMETIPTMRLCRLLQQLVSTSFGFWQDTCRPVEYDVHGRSGAFISSAFPYDAAQDVYLCPAGKRLTLHVVKNGENGVRTHVYRAPKAACRTCALRDQCVPNKKLEKVGIVADLRNYFTLELHQQRAGIFQRRDRLFPPS